MTIPCPVPTDFAEHVNSESIRALSVRYGRNKDTIYRWIEVSGITRQNMRGGIAPRSVPDDFRAIQADQTIVELAGRYGVSTDMIDRWRREVGGKSVDKQGPPADFADRWATMSLIHLRKHYRIGSIKAASWIKELGLSRAPGKPIRSKAKPKPEKVARARSKPVKAIAPKKLPALGHRVTQLVAPSRGNGEAAATYLQSNRGGGWSVFRCDEAGRQLQGGKFWRVGRMVLPDAEVIAMAERKGFDPDAWKRIAA